MKNLDQYRAASALQFWQNDATKRLLGRESSSVARQLPLLLATQGLLPLIAFAKSSGGLTEAMLAEAGRFLSSPDMKILPVTTVNLDQFLAVLTNERSTSLLLQRATAEAMAYLAYLRRLTPH